VSVDIPEPEDHRGLGRRQMIAASAVAGVAAWTAPAIVDSLASPAAAVAHVCNVYVFKVTRNGDLATCTAAINAVCATPTLSGAGASCSAFTRVNSTTSPINFSNPGTCTGGNTETTTFAINTAGHNFVGTATSATVCASTLTLTAASGTSASVTQTGVPQNGVWYAILVIT
jgi:hypothetical protein